MKNIFNTFVILLVIISSIIVLGLPFQAISEQDEVFSEKDHKVIIGKVIGVTDGDTITILNDKIQYKIRLAEIDTPEKKQPFGTKCKQILSDKVFGKEVKVLWDKEDRYKRIIGTIILNERNINKEMVSEGFAWHYKQYSKSKELEELEQKAREEKRGLWADKNPIPPWEFRKKK